MRGWHEGLMLPKGTYVALMPRWSQKGPRREVGRGRVTCEVQGLAPLAVN